MTAPLVHPQRFQGRVAIVTGGSHGIGRAIVAQLRDQGAKVAYTALPEDAADSGAPSGPDIAVFTGDMQDEAFCHRVVDQTVEQFDRVDFLVNNAFSFNAMGLDSTPADWDRIMQVGPAAFARMIQRVAEPMRQVGGGSIVNMSSISSHIAQPNRWTYNAAKAAVNQLTRCAAMDLAPHGIRVNAVSPGWVWTREVEKAAGGDRAKWEPVWGQYHLLERLCETEEIARPVLFLLSEESSFMTGSELRVDGGYCAMGPEGLGRSSSFAGTD